MDTRINKKIIESINKKMEMKKMTEIKHTKNAEERIKFCVEQLKLIEDEKNV
jgi:hypothetical protein